MYKDTLGNNGGRSEVLHSQKRSTTDVNGTSGTSNKFTRRQSGGFSSPRACVCESNEEERPEAQQLPLSRISTHRIVTPE